MRDEMNNCLRPHHGMCFQFYEGKGYSADFTDHMGRVIKELEADPEQKVVLKAETDIVCENCPNNEGGVCTTRGDICGDCSWDYICREKKSRYEDSE